MWRIKYLIWFEKLSKTHNKIIDNKIQVEANTSNLVARYAPAFGYESFLFLKPVYKQANVSRSLSNMIFAFAQLLAV